MAGIEPHALALDARPGLPEQLERLVVAAKLDADLPQNPVGMRFQPHQLFFVEQIVRRNLAGDLSGSNVCAAGGPARQADGPSATARSAMWRWGRPGFGA